MKIFLLAASIWAACGSLSAQSVTAQDMQRLRVERQAEIEQRQREEAIIRWLASHVELRRVGEKTYNVGYLKAWLGSAGSTPRPLPDWEEIKGRIDHIAPEGTFVQTEKTVRSYYNPLPRPDRFARRGLYLTEGAATYSAIYGNARAVREEHTEDAGLVLVKRLPIRKGARQGEHVECLAMRSGSASGTPVFDFGEPVESIKPSPAAVAAPAPAKVAVPAGSSK